MKKFLLVGADPNSPTDGVIIKGIKYLLSRSFPHYMPEFIIITDTLPQTETDFKKGEIFDAIIVCGTPWLWDSFQLSIKYKNLCECFAAHPKSKKVFLGIGTCLYLDQINTDVLERPDEVKAMKSLFTDAIVIVREDVAYEKLKKSGIKSYSLPCPAYFCYGDKKIVNHKSYNVLVFQDPAQSISRGQWQSHEKLKKYFDRMRDFKDFYSPMVVCTTQSEVEIAIREGLSRPRVLQSPDETLELMANAYHVLSGRVHCAVPAQVAGASFDLIPLDTRSLVIYDYAYFKNFKPYLAQYDQILRGIFDRQVGTESQRTYKLYQSNGFFDKYMSGFGLDIGFAGYSAGAKPILASAIGVDKDYPGYDGTILPFEDNSQNYVYSSHCLEHIDNYQATIQEWHRVLKPNGYAVIIVPHQFLYEKKANLPSKWNLDHKRFYTPASLLKEIEESLPPNSYRVRFLEDGDREFNYKLPPDTHSAGQYEITLVIQKIKPPLWDLAK